MPGNDNTVDWRELREFGGVDLVRSFALSWHFQAETLVIDTDMLLLPDHPFYEKPRPAEKVCIRPAFIEFPFCENVVANGTGHGGDIGACVAGLGHGAISDLRRNADGHYEIRGDFGTLVVEAERPIVRLKGP